MKYARRDAKQWARETLKDYFVVTTTPMKADLSIDEAGIAANIDRILRWDGAKGIYLNSIYQEFWTLTMAERKRLVEVSIKAVNGRVPVNVGINSSCTADVIELGQHAQEAGADLVMIWPPTFGQRSPEGVIEYYKEITAELDIGVCIYASALSEIGFQITAPMMLELAKIENIVAAKEASLNLATYLRTLEDVGDKICVSSPLEEYWLIGRAMLGDAKAPGFMLGSSRPLYMQNERRGLLNEFLEAANTGDLRQANTSLQEILLIANKLHNKYLSRGEHNVALTKVITGMFGYASGPVRPAITMPPADVVNDARKVLEDAGFLEAAA